MATTVRDPRPWLTWAAVVIVVGGSFLLIRRGSAPPIQASPPVVSTLTALGYLEPWGEVVRLSAPTSGEGSRVDRVLVKEGDPVEAGQVVAILDSRDRLQAALEQAEGQLRVSQASLTKVQAGAKSGEIRSQQASIQRIQAQWAGDRATQRATIARLEAQWQGDRLAQQATIDRIRAELNNAEAEYERNERLANQGAISVSALDGKRLSLETSRAQLREAEAALARTNQTAVQQLTEARAALGRIESTANQQVQEARATLDQIAEVRPVDIEVAAAQVQADRAAMRRARANLAQAFVRAPISGRILKIHARPGEVVSSDGIAEIGQTQEMAAVLEVYESDIGGVRLGQPVKIFANAMPEPLSGTVERVGLKVQRQNVVNADPSSNVDARVVEVRVRLSMADSKRVAGLTNLQVTGEMAR